MVHVVHAACRAIWQKERPGAPDSHDKATGASAGSGAQLM